MRLDVQSRDVSRTYYRRDRAITCGIITRAPFDRVARMCIPQCGASQLRPSSTYYTNRESKQHVAAVGRDCSVYIRVLERPAGRRMADMW